MSLNDISNDEEAISALMDDELSDFELRRLLKALPEKPEITAQWSRFSQVRALIDNKADFALSNDFAASVMAGIDEEPAYKLGDNPDAKPRVVGRLFSGLGKFAVAASVAAAAFIGMQMTLNGSAGFSDAPVAQSGFNNTAEQESAVTLMAGIEPGVFDAEAQQRLNDYIRSVSIQSKEDAYTAPQFNVLQDSQLIRQVNQIER
jgi:negative regulator of sigma E activity